MHVTLHRGQQNPRGTVAVVPLHKRFEQGDRSLHDLSRLENKRQEQLALAEQFTHVAHGRHQYLVDDIDGLEPFTKNGEQILQTVLVAVQHLVKELLLVRSGGLLLLVGGRGQSPAEMVDEAHQRILLPILLSVVEKVQADLPIFRGNPCQGEDPGRIDNGRIEPGRHRLVQEHGIQKTPRGRSQTKGDVAHPEYGQAARQFRLDPADALQGLQGRVAQGLVAGTDGEGQTVEEQVLGTQAALVHRDRVDGPGHTQFVVRGHGHALLVDGQRDHRGPVLLRGPADPADVHAAVLEIDGVDDRPAGVDAQAGLDDLRRGRIDHQGRFQSTRTQPHQCGQIGHLVAAGVGGAQVDDVCPPRLLFDRNPQTGLVVVGEQQFAELFRTVGVGPLTDEQRRDLLLQFNRLIETGHRRLHRTTSRRAGCTPSSSSTKRRMWAAVVPQQPPTTLTP